MNMLNLKHNRSSSTVLEQDHFYSDFLLSQTTVPTNSHNLDDVATRRSHLEGTPTGLRVGAVSMTHVRARERRLSERLFGNSN